MTRARELQDLFAYNRWANARILDAAGALPAEDFVRDLGSSFPSVRDTLVHLLFAEWTWLSRWEGTSPTGLPPEWAGMDHERLCARWREVEARQARCLEGLDEAGLDRTLAYTSLAGRPQATPLVTVLRHVLNHSAYHRGQVVTLLRQLGASPPSTDLILHARLQGGSA